MIRFFTLPRHVFHADPKIKYKFLPPPFVFIRSTFRISNLPTSLPHTSLRGSEATAAICSSLRIGDCHGNEPLAMTLDQVSFLFLPSSNLESPLSPLICLRVSYPHAPLHTRPTLAAALPPLQTRPVARPGARSPRTRRQRPPVWLPCLRQLPAAGNRLHLPDGMPLVAAQWALRRVNHRALLR